MWWILFTIIIYKIVDLTTPPAERDILTAKDKLQIFLFGLVLVWIVRINLGV